MASRLRGWLGAGVNQTLVYKYFFQNAYCRRRMSVTMSKRMISYGSLFQLKKTGFLVKLRVFQIAWWRFQEILPIRFPSEGLSSKLSLNNLTFSTSSSSKQRQLFWYIPGGQWNLVFWEWDDFSNVIFFIREIRKKCSFCPFWDGNWF